MRRRANDTARVASSERYVQADSSSANAISGKLARVLKRAQSKAACMYNTVNCRETACFSGFVPQ